MTSSCDKPTSFQVMFWCRQVARYNRGKWRPRSISPNGVTKRQWINRVVMMPTLSSLAILDYVCFAATDCRVRIITVPVTIDIKEKHHRDSPSNIKSALGNATSIITVEKSSLLYLIIYVIIKLSSPDNVVIIMIIQSKVETYNFG